MSELRKALDLYKASVVQEARAELEKLKSISNEVVVEAVARLDGLVNSWEQAADRLQGFGLASIADIALAGGMVWAWTTTKGQGTPTESAGLRQVMDNLRPGDWTIGPHLRWDPSVAYECFLLVVPAPAEGSRPGRKP